MFSTTGEEFLDQMNDYLFLMNGVSSTKWPTKTLNLVLSYLVS